MGSSDVGVDMRCLLSAASAIQERSMTWEGREKLINDSGTIAEVALAMSLVVSRLKEHAKEAA